MRRTDRAVLLSLCRGTGLPTDRQPASTVYSAVKRLVEAGLVVRTTAFEIEDPFFRYWIRTRLL